MQYSRYGIIQIKLAAQEQALAGSIAGMAGPVLGGVASFGKGLFQEGGVFNPVNQEG